MTARRSLLALAALAASLFGCSKPFYAATPPGYVELEDRYQDDEYRATSADGVVLGVRALENEPKGELSFWSKAIQNRMQTMGGYALLETRPVKTHGGLAGTQFRFGHDEGREPHLYLLTVFVDDDHVFLVEAGGAKSEVDRQMPQIEWSVRNFQVP